MTNTAMSIFAAIGALAVIVVGGCVFICLYFWLYNVIDEKKYEYERKHRFDKPPTAKCYCADCRNWRKEDGYCFFFENRHTADCWFCWNAEPLSHNEYSRREQANEEDNQ